MKSLSIKAFTLTTSAFLLIGIILTFFNFYQHFKGSMADLLTNNIQTDILNLKHYLGKNLEPEHVNELVSHLDSITSSSHTIKNIQIVDNNGYVLYSTDRKIKEHKEQCIPISNITTQHVFENRCYSFPIKLYKDLEPYYYHSDIFIDEEYMHNLLNKQTVKLLTYFIVLLFIFFILLWYTLKKVIVLPLEQLRQYAYYSSKLPNRFFIRELESVRYSLSITFQRLRNEQNELYKLSTKDQLSGLYNRMSLIEKIEWLISNKGRKEEHFAVIFLDLDNFKNINDSMGHDFGDRVLQNISQTLLGLVREHDIVSRLGGDEFVLVLSDLNSETRVVDVVERIKEKLSQPIIFEDIKYTLTASMGISIYPRDGKDVHTLLKNADIAMYKSKELGKNSYQFFTNKLNNMLQEKIHMQNLMVSALENGYFQLYYQPKTDVVTGKIDSCEALIRLIDPEEGLIPPDKFIPLAEDSNFIIKLGEWVIQESTRQIKAWQNTALKDIKISINISVKQFQDPYLLDHLMNYSQGMDRKLLDIELTESVFVTDFDTTYRAIEEIKDLGMTLSLDDFGTGYSSLSYLKQIPFDTIKIDKTFIDDLDADNDKSFVSMIIDIAKVLNFHVVAEGVETQEQLTYLQELECDYYQGYLCSKPLPAEEFEELIKSQKKF